MARLKAGPLAAALEARRAAFNEDYVLAKQRFDGLDQEVFSTHLVEVVAPIIEAVAAVDADAVETVVATLYSLSLDLVGRRYVGGQSRFPAIVAAWRTVLPRLAGLIAKAPRQVVAAVTNGVYNLCSTTGVDAEGWAHDLQAVATGCRTVEEFLLAGQVLAWRRGMAHWRESALARWRRLPKELRLATLDLLIDEERLSLEEIEASLEDPWLEPGQSRHGERELAIVGRTGGFRGFGGPFLTPPEVTAVDNRLFAFDDERCWSIHGDCFGTTVQPYGRDLPSATVDGEVPFSVSPKGTVAFYGHRKRFSELSNPSSSAATEHCVAVTVHASHKIFLVAAVPKSS